jgi:hypothetical protein
VAAGGDGTPAPDTTTTVEAVASPVMSEAATGDHVASTSPAVGALSSPPQMAAATASVGADDSAVKGGA